MVSRWFAAVLASCSGGVTAVDLSFPDDLPRTPGGKTKPVTSLVGAPRVRAVGG